MNDISEIKENKKKLTVKEKKKFLEELKEKYPVFKKAKPLKIGIFDELWAENPHFTRSELKQIMSFHVNSEKYIRKLVKKNHRYNLQDEKVEELSPEVKEKAIIRMEIIKKFQEEIEDKKKDKQKTAKDPEVDKAQEEKADKTDKAPSSGT